jgi:beta-glucanase (GH16 family)
MLTVFDMLAHRSPVFADDGLPGALSGVAGQWSLAFGDDFRDAARFDREWRRVSNAGDETKTMRLPQNDVLGKEGLALQLADNPDRGDTKHPFTGGYVEGLHFRQCYGYFECEMRIADEAGVDNAFWLVSDPKTQDEHHFELDVAEAKYPNAVQASARLWRPAHRVLSRTLHAPEKLSLDFHRYGLLWSPGDFSFFFDDRAFFSAPNDFAHTPALIRLSNAVAAFAGEDDGDVRGAATLFRRVRVFQNSDWLKAPAAQKGA